MLRSETELQGRRDSIVQTDLFRDLVVLDTENGRAESHSLARGGRNADKQITVGRARMRASTIALLFQLRDPAPNACVLAGAAT